MEEAIKKRYSAWLNGNFDDDTKVAIRQLEKENPNELADAFYRNLNSVQVDCVVSWELAPTV